MDYAQVLIIGAGPAGLSAAEASCKIKKVVLAGAENYLPYYRPRLSKILSKMSPPEVLAIKPKEWFDKNNITLLLNHTAVQIEPKQKKVTWQDGNFTVYETLILSAGSYSFIPPIPDVEKPLALRSYDDAVAIHEAALKARKAVVFGGGLLGLETAYNLSEAGVDVTVIERNEWLLSRQLPKEGGEYLSSFLKQHGIAFVLNADTNAQQDKTKGACVVTAAGVRPNTAFLQGSGMNIEKAVLVDDHMKTNISDIYACGDVAQFNGKVLGLYPIATEQGKVAGENAAGGNTAYSEVPPSPMLKIGNLSVFSAGDNLNGTVYFENSKDTFRSITVRDNILIGGALIGDISKASKLKNAVLQGKQVFAIKTVGEVVDSL